MRKCFTARFDRFGRPQSPYPPGQAIAMLPWYAAGQFVGRHLPGVPPRFARRHQRFLSDGRERLFLGAGRGAGAVHFPAARNRAEHFLVGRRDSGSRHAPRCIFRLAVFRTACGGPAARRCGCACLPHAGARNRADIQHCGGRKRGFNPWLFAGVARLSGRGDLGEADARHRRAHISGCAILRDREKGWSAATALAVAAGAVVALLLWRNAYLHGSPSNLVIPSPPKAERR